MTDQRSTRRLVQQEKSPESGPTADGVKSIISEIDGIVDGLPGVGKQVANSKGQAAMSEMPADHARMQPQDAFQFTPGSKDETFDIDQLEQELNVAIAAELGDDPVAEETVEPPKGDVVTDRDDAQAAGDAETTNQTPCETLEEPVARTEGFDGQDDLPSRPSSTIDHMLRPLSAPVERLSPNARQVLNVITISTALWVPVVWIAIMTDGFGLLSIETPAQVTVMEEDGIEPVSVR
jgi:hypothetical protein